MDPTIAKDEVATTTLSQIVASFSPNLSTVRLDADADAGCRGYMEDLEDLEDFWDMVTSYVGLVGTDTPPDADVISRNPPPSKAHSGTTMESGDVGPATKRPKREGHHSPDGPESNAILSVSCLCQRLLSTDHRHRLPSRLLHAPIGNDVGKFQQLFNKIGFRTTLVYSPRTAVSIYKDSVDPRHYDNNTEDFQWMALMLGWHHRQDEMEQFYANSNFRELYQIWLFATWIRKVCSKDDAIDDCDESNDLASELAQIERDRENIRSQRDAETVQSSLTAWALSTPGKVQRWIQLAVTNDPRWRHDQFQQEWERIQVRNCTLSNAMIQIFSNACNLTIRDIYWKHSTVPMFERLTISLHDPMIDAFCPTHFVIQPSSKIHIDKGPEALVDAVVASFWAHLLRLRYYASSELRNYLNQPLRRYFLSGIGRDKNIPSKLNATFEPTYPLAIYLHGPAGSGKSSLARLFPHALHATIRDHIDPEIQVRSVKQNLNKHINTLRLEMDLRSNNNDLSLMSIVQGRRLTLTQSKPGLVVLNLEEMPSNKENADPKQEDVCQLISQRFSGRKGQFREGTAARNSDKHGISDDCSVIPIMTSNYELDGTSIWALQKLGMFSKVVSVPVTAIEGKERHDFAQSYLEQSIRDRLADQHILDKIQCNATMGKYQYGDTRVLVRFLKIIAFMICQELTGTESTSLVISDILEEGDGFIGCQIKGLARDLVITERLCLDTSVTGVLQHTLSLDLKRELRDIFPVHLSTILGIQVVFNLWLERVFTPAVIVTDDAAIARAIFNESSKIKFVHSIPNIDADIYQMQRSLYDSVGAPNLRDDIMAFGKESFVSIHLLCNTSDSQMCIREMIEDSPSMSAFSRESTALTKDGLMFIVQVSSCDITPEIVSRASLIISQNQDCKY